MTKNSLLEGAYPARKLSESPPRTPFRLGLGAAFIVTLLLSLGMWWAIWSAATSLFSG
jgi:hypothetical protein